MGRRRAGARDPRILRASLILAAPLLLLPSCAPTPKRKPVPAAVQTARITQFYARDGVLPRGEKTVLRYGVENAKSVRLSPPVDRVWPSVSRCLEISPTQETTYTLTAEGQDGQAVTQSVTVIIGPPRPRIVEVSVNSLNVRAGQQVSVCYKVRSAASVKVVPGQALDLRIVSTEHGCAVDRPRTTTTYTVTAYGANGITDTEHVTVNVK